MGQIVLIEDNPSLNELLSINLTTYVGVEVIPRKNAEDAIGLLNILPNVDLIICSHKIGEEDTAKLLVNYINDRKLDTGLIILGGNAKSHSEHAVIIENASEWEKVINTSAKILGISQEILAKKVLPDYIPIPVSYFARLDTSCCDVFIRIKKGPDDFQFVKRIHSGDTFSKTMVKRYVEQGLTHFYIPKELQKNFTNFLSDQLVKILENNFENIDEQIEVVADSYNVATKEILKLGFTSATVQLTDSIVDNMVEIFDKSSEMSTLLHKIINSKSSYLYQHCHMTSVVASECIKNLGIETKADHEKLAFAAFFKDISFVDNEDLAKITTYEELEKAEISEEDWDLVFNHALESSVLIRKHPEAPLGVDDIVKHHHGSMNGKGFSTANVTKLTSLQQIFLISAEFVKELMAYRERGGKPTPIIEELYQKYPTPDMVSVIKALETTLKRKSK
ncbi:MAG: hypothetical protein CME70_14300 [Halobacteriovorax sp.]|nr:hypothetical protein [Halobacteriovorax sp.]|tara:strand:- start:279145 stop:280494 length:1350 start_codon:yes stop_codon:yes gene_type:complete